MPDKLTITATTLQRCCLGCYVLVDALGPRGGTYEFTVWIDRRGTLQNASRTAPDGVFYATSATIPQAVAQAAQQAYDNDQDT